MADVTLPDGAASPREDPPSSAGSQPAAPVEAAPPAPPLMSDELKGRLDKVIYSDVSLYVLFPKRNRLEFHRIALTSPVCIDRHYNAPDSIEAKRRIRQSSLKLPNPEIISYMLTPTERIIRRF